MIPRRLSVAIATLLLVLSGQEVNGQEFVDCSADFSFSSIATTGTRLDTVSNSDDTAETVNLPFSFPAIDGNSYMQWSVSPDGFMEPNSPVRISVAAADLDPGDDTNANVFILADGANSYTVSWEGIPFQQAGNSFGNGEVNAQITLFPDGRVVLCYGADGDIPDDEEILAQYRDGGEEIDFLSKCLSEWLAYSFHGAVNC